MAAPRAMSMLVQALYNIVDSVYVSRLSEQALSAVSLAFPAGWIMCSLLLTVFYRRSRLFTAQMEEDAAAGV